MKITLSKIHKRRTPKSEPIAGYEALKGIKIDGLNGICTVWKTETGASVQLWDHVIDLDKSMISILSKRANKEA